jgi:hypothetical protein
MATSNTDDDVQDVIDYWHLCYQGDMELDEFMQSQLGWTDMEYQYWEVTGKLPGDEGNG